MKAKPTWRYRLCLRLVSPILLLHMVWRSYKEGGRRYLQERLGFGRTDKRQRIHIHAASVGEIITLLPLLQKLQTLHPQSAFLLTTNTPTGAAILDNRLTANATHRYLPLDFPGATKRFFKRSTITQCWVVETEIWPWLYARAKQHGIPLTLINARLSQKSHGLIASLFATTYRQALTGVRVLARSHDDAERYKRKGAQPQAVSSLGNLKFAHTAHPVSTQALLTTPYVLAASTHDDEELQLAQAWLNASIDHLLVIAPRHPDRGARLMKSLCALQQQIDARLPLPAQRSLGQQPAKGSRLYLADTLGEMQHWYTHATLAFVGGSLIKRGGHNVLEPARVNTGIVVGPHTFNFEAEVSLLKAAKGIAIADNADEAVQLLSLGVSDPQWANTLGKHANTALSAQGDVLERYCNVLMPPSDEPLT